MSNVPTKAQVSAGGVVYRRTGKKIEVVLIAVGEKRRWQLPKGIVNAGEHISQTAVREVKEETGIDSAPGELIDQIEYWYYGQRGNSRVRFHKIVHFYLLAFQSGNIEDHDKEVEEARWLEIDEAHDLLSFKTEKEIVAKAKKMIQTPSRPKA
ncbi:MAG: NUDIX hydrolase [Chloroflexota bacterium]